MVRPRKDRYGASNNRQSTSLRFSTPASTAMAVSSASSRQTPRKQRFTAIDEAARECQQALARGRHCTRPKS